MFSPYGRAYEISHGVDPTYGYNGVAEQTTVQQDPQDMQNLQASTILADQQPLDIPSSVEAWLSSGEAFPSSCNCGDGCTCPGCADHNGGRAAAPGVSAFSSCAHPGTCSHCLDCTILSLPTLLPPNSPLSIYDSSQTQSIDEWIRQISAQSNTVADNVQSSMPTNIAMTPAYASSPWEDGQMSQISEPTRNSPSSECCNGRCKCPSGSCACPADCCGCCQGCECAEHEHHHDLAAKAHGLTFATSTERGSCCSGASSRVIRSLESFERGGRLDLSVRTSSGDMSNGNRGLLDIPDISRSRSSSTSESGYSTDLSTMFTTPRPAVSSKLPSSGSSSSGSSAARFRISNLSNVSPHPGTPGGSKIDPNSGITFVSSSSDSEVSPDEQAYQYNTSLDRMHLY